MRNPTTIPHISFPFLFWPSASPPVRCTLRWWVVVLASRASAPPPVSSRIHSRCRSPLAADDPGGTKTQSPLLSTSRPPPESLPSPLHKIPDAAPPSPLHAAESALHALASPSSPAPSL